jgi:outer membrane protein insertion porin family
MLPDRVNLRALLVIVFVAFAAAVSPPLAAQEEQRVVRGLSFEGNHAIDGYTLESAIATTKSGEFASKWWLRWMGLGEKRYFDELEFRRDVVRLLLLYRQSGYMNAVIDTLVRRTPKDVWVQFRIYEGAPVRVTKLEVLGIDSVAYDVRGLRRRLPLQVGDPFDRFLFQASADTVATWLRNRGYPWADVLRNFDSDAATLSAQVSLEAVPGPHARVGKIDVRGLERVDTSTVLRVLSVHPGDPYREEVLYQSQRDLFGLGLFRGVSVGLLDTVPPAAGEGRATSDTLVGIVVRVAEGPRHGVRFGAGYGSIDCFRIQAGWTARNFLGGARSLDLTGRLSKLGVGYPFDAGLRTKPKLCGSIPQEDRTSDTVNFSVGATLTQPAFPGPRHATSVGVFAERRSEINAYVRLAVGMNLAVTFNARRSIPITVGYTFSVGRTSADPAVYCNLFRVCADSDQKFLSDPRRFAAVTVGAVRNRINNVLDPTAGGLVSLNLMHSSRLVGSDSLYEFNRGELEISRFYPLGRRGVFAWRVRAGTLLPQSITLSGQSAQVVPPDQRFYGGGPNSVRGYPLNELGPRVYVDTVTDTAQQARVRTEPTGGNSLFVVNAELRFATPLFPQRMRAALFVDAGQVWQREQEVFTTKSLRVTPGVGLRFTTPLGPVRLDVAYNGYPNETGPLLVQNGTSLTKVLDSYRKPRSDKFLRRLQFQFAVGQAF